MLRVAASLRTSSLSQRVPTAPVPVRHVSFLTRLGQGLEQFLDGRPGRTLIGEDEQGNKYYVSPPTRRMVATTSHVKEVREVIYADSASPEDYVPGRIPYEWQAWLSGQSLHPPHSVGPTEVASSNDQPPNMAEAWGYMARQELSAGTGTEQREAAAPTAGPASLHDRRAAEDGQPTASGSSPKLARYQAESWQPGGAPTRRAARKPTDEALKQE